MIGKVVQREGTSGQEGVGQTGGHRATTRSPKGQESPGSEECADEPEGRRIAKMRPFATKAPNTEASTESLGRCCVASQIHLQAVISSTYFPLLPEKAPTANIRSDSTGDTYIAVETKEDSS